MKIFLVELECQLHRAHKSPFDNYIVTETKALPIDTLKEAWLTAKIIISFVHWFYFIFKRNRLIKRPSSTFVSGIVAVSAITFISRTIKCKNKKINIIKLLLVTYSLKVWEIRKSKYILWNKKQHNHNSIRFRYLY